MFQTSRVSIIFAFVNSFTSTFLVTKRQDKVSCIGTDSKTAPRVPAGGLTLTTLKKQSESIKLRRRKWSQTESFTRMQQAWRQTWTSAGRVFHVPIGVEVGEKFRLPSQLVQCKLPSPCQSQWKPTRFPLSCTLLVQAQTCDGWRTAEVFRWWSWYTVARIRCTIHPNKYKEGT